MTSAEIFGTLIDLTEKYTLIQGFGKIDKHPEYETFYITDLTEDSYWALCGKENWDLIKDALCEEYICEVEQAGCYEFKALLYYNRPDEECHAYMEVAHIQFNFQMSFEELKEQEKGTGVSEDLPF